MTLRALGPTNAVLPVPTGMVQGFIRKTEFPFNKYVQYVPAPDVQFSYWRLDPDENVRLVELNQYAWHYGDFAPTGKGETERVELISDRIRRWNFPWTIDDQTIDSFGNQNISPTKLLNLNKMNQAKLHLATQVLNTLSAADFGSNTSTPAAITGLAGGFFDLSSGVEQTVAGTPNPNYGIILTTFQQIKQYLTLGTNGAIDGSEMVAVLPVKVAQAIAKSGEMREWLKQSQFAKEISDPNIVNWNLPPSYGGFTLVVEDTVRCYINQKADGTVASVTATPTEKGFALTDDTVYFLSRPGGLDGGYGYQNFSSVQVYTLNGQMTMRARSDSWNQLQEGQIVMENKVVFPAAIASFKLTDCLST